VLIDNFLQKATKADKKPHWCIEHQKWETEAHDEKALEKDWNPVKGIVGGIRSGVGKYIEGVKAGNTQRQGWADKLENWAAKQGQPKPPDEPFVPKQQETEGEKMDRTITERRNPKNIEQSLLKVMERPDEEEEDLKISESDLERIGGGEASEISRVRKPSAYEGYKSEYEHEEQGMGINPTPEQLAEDTMRAKPHTVPPDRPEQIRNSLLKLMKGKDDEIEAWRYEFRPNAPDTGAFAHPYKRYVAEHGKPPSKIHVRDHGSHPNTSPDDSDWEQPGIMTPEQMGETEPYVPPTRTTTSLVDDTGKPAYRVDREEYMKPNVHNAITKSLLKLMKEEISSKVQNLGRDVKPWEPSKRDEKKIQIGEMTTHTPGVATTYPLEGETILPPGPNETKEDWIARTFPEKKSIQNSLLKIMKYGSSINPTEVGMTRKNATQDIGKAQGVPGFPRMAPASGPKAGDPEGKAEATETAGSGANPMMSGEYTALGSAHGVADALAGAIAGKKQPPGPSMEDIAEAAGRGAARAFPQQQQQQQESSETGTPPAASKTTLPLGVPDAPTPSSEGTNQSTIPKPNKLPVPGGTLTASMKKAFGIRSK